MVSVHEPISRLECGTSLVEQIDYELRNRHGRYAIDSLSVAEDVLVSRAKFRVPATDESFLGN